MTSKAQFFRLSSEWVVLIKPVTGLTSAKQLIQLQKKSKKRPQCENSEVSLVSILKLIIGVGFRHFAENLSNLLVGVGRDHLRTEGLKVGHAPEVIRVVAAHLQNPLFFAFPFYGEVQVFFGHGNALVKIWASKFFAGREVMLDLIEDPWITD